MPGHRHWMGGGQRLHPDLRLPLCSGCASQVEVLFRIDFDDQRLRAMDLWDGELILCLCADGMCDALETTVWSHVDPRAPVMVSSLPVFHERYRYEFERLPVVLLGSASADDVARIGGALSWTQDESTPQCTCGRPMTFLMQWVEGPWQKPKALNRDGELGSPHLRQWFGCRVCRAVASRIDL